MITIKDLSISFAEKTLFSQFSVFVAKGDRIGLIGKNGSGKTTLLKAIAGLFDDYAGEISVKGAVVYLDQYRSFDAVTPFEYYSQVADTPEKQKNVRGILKGFGFDEKDWHRDISTFSGGERTKLQLGRLFIQQPDFLLLDEPTNFLDIEGIELLKNLLKKFRGGYIVVSHDRDFLRNVCNKFWEINNERVWVFDTDFDGYRSQRELIIQTQERQLANAQREIERLKKIIDQYRKWGRDKAVKQAKSRQKMLDRMLEELEKMPNQYLEEQERHIKIPEPESSGYIALQLKDLSFNSLISDATFTMYSKDKIALIGPNGSGKSTLLKIIAGLLSFEGTVKIGHNVKMVYLDQFVEQLDQDSSAFDEIFEEMPEEPDYVIRAYLGRFGFKGEDAFKFVSQMSGGERQILALAMVLLRRPNLLLLDEPTNHMDLLTVEALESALKEYQGSLLIVSHDIELIKNICNRFLTIKDGKVIEVDEPLFFKTEKNQPTEKKENTSFDEKKRLKNQIKSLKRRLEELKDFEKSATEKIEWLGNQLLATNDYQKIMRLSQEKEDLEHKVLAALEEMEEIEQKIMQLEEKMIQDL
ncbi:ribosomal protection-like ABC-F family protein [Pseudothermotoga sp. U03pept]|uniref:ribosomal protection-like ABC-F family protein n=1 Tax=Pseudothermotoga sp. U03pept TaxID=3447012 RepID=UPI003094B121